MTLQKGYWEGPPEEIWRAAKRSGLSIFYIKGYPDIIFVKDWINRGPFESRERRTVRHWRRLAIFNIRLIQSLSLSVQYREHGLFGATNACHFGFAFDLQKLPQMELGPAGDSAR